MLNESSCPAQAWKKLLTLRSSFCLPSSCAAAQVEATLKAGFNSSAVANVTAGAGVQVVVRLPVDYTATAAPRRQVSVADSIVM